MVYTWVLKLFLCPHFRCLDPLGEVVLKGVKIQMYLHICTHISGCTYKHVHVKDFTRLRNLLKIIRSQTTWTRHGHATRQK